MESAARLIASMPAGRWAVGVSGGADSVALLLLVRNLPGVSLHVVHLDHQARGQASTDDAEFVRQLADSISLPVTIARRDQIEPEMKSLPGNLSASFRAVRFELFRRVVEKENLQGVLLAHHADDQAETILLRLLRGSGPRGLAGMSVRQRIDGLTVLRPLLDVRGSELRQFLSSRGQTWREDASNKSDKYARNRIRRFLQSRPDLHDPLLALGRACADYRRWTRDSAPPLKERFPAVFLEDLPLPLARESARRWLIARGVPPAELTAHALDRLVEMATDAATPPRQKFPGNVLIHRRSGWIERQS
jgi:tRNA(Ile)-lysidine synthetase-like protein